MKTNLKNIIGNSKSLSIMGMCKNAGKTTVLNALIKELQTSGVRLALTSIGRDGESTDIVTQTGKPGIYIYENTLLATAEGLLKYCDISREIIGTTGYNTPMGEVIILNAKSDGFAQLGGPSITAQLTKLNERFISFGAELTVVDGALGRKTLAAPAVCEAAILCTGASYHKNIHKVVEDTAFAAELFSLKKTNLFDGVLSQDKASYYVLENLVYKMDKNELLELLRTKNSAQITAVYLHGALTEAMAKAILTLGKRSRPLQLVVEDGSKLLISKDIYDKFAIANIEIAVKMQTRLAAITVNPFSAYGYHFNKDELYCLMAKKVNVPVLNVLAGDGGEIE